LRWWRPAPAAVLQRIKGNPRQGEVQWRVLSRIGPSISSSREVRQIYSGSPSHLTLSQARLPLLQLPGQTSRPPPSSPPAPFSQARDTRRPSHASPAAHNVLVHSCRQLAHREPIGHQALRAQLTEYMINQSPAPPHADSRISDTYWASRDGFTPAHLGPGRILTPGERPTVTLLGFTFASTSPSWPRSRSVGSRLWTWCATCPAPMSQPTQPQLQAHQRPQAATRASSRLSL